MFFYQFILHVFMRCVLYFLYFVYFIVIPPVQLSYRIKGYLLTYLLTYITRSSIPVQVVFNCPIPSNVLIHV